MLQYREARKGDEENILQLIKTALGEHGLALEVEGADADAADLTTHYLKNDGWFQVVEDEGHIIGSVGIYKIDEKRCELRKMYLYPEYQGKKIGKKLMENALEAAKEMGFEWMLLQTSSKLVKALPLYEKYGFVDDKDGEVCARCDIAMIRKL